MMIADAANAMPIIQFDKMADKDQSTYVGLLVEGAEKVLADEGRKDLVDKAHHLFSTKLGNDTMTVGMTQFEVNLARVRLLDAKNVAANPGAARLEVEHAMILTLKNNDVLLPTSFMTVGRNFKPMFPRR